MKIQSWLQKAVILIHATFVLILFISPDFGSRKKERKQLIVKTVVPPPKTKVASVAKKTMQASASPKPVSAPQQKKPAPVAAPAPVVKKTAPPTPAPAAKPAAPAVKKEPAIADKVLKPGKAPPPQPQQNRAKISDSLLQELEESIAKIETNKDKKVVSSKAAAPITLQIDAAEDYVGDYTDALVSCLHEQLKLPEFGEVKIQLSLRQDGTVVKVNVLTTQSEKNRRYLETNLPRVMFPRFEGAYANKKESTFVLTFCNESVR